MESYTLYRQVRDAAEARASDPSCEAIFTELLKKGCNDTLKEAVATLFLLRDYRVGLGQRDAFYTLFVRLWSIYPSLGQALLEKIPEYGSWADLVRLADRYETLTEPCLALFARQLLKDKIIAEMDPEAIPSLAAKWAPREGKQYDRLARLLAKKVAGVEGYVTPGNQRRLLMLYRRLVADLNRRLGTVEVLECSNAWNTIDPAETPLRARQIKWRAYLNLPGPQDRAGAVRRSADSRREICRANFLSFHALQASKEAYIPAAEINSAEALKAVLAKSVFDSVHSVLTEWIEGGWRTIL